MTIEGLGKKFQEARLARNLTLDEASRITKIRALRLAEIEADDFSNFPSLAYAKGFLLIYGKFLDVDVSSYLEAFETSNAVTVDGYSYLQDNPAPKASPAIIRAPRRRTSLLPLVIGILVLAVGLSLIKLILNISRITPPRKNSDAQPSPTAMVAPGAIIAPRALPVENTPSRSTASSTAVAAPSATPAATIPPPAVSPAASEPEVRRAEPVHPEDLARAGIQPAAAGSESAALNRVEIRPIKKTYIKVVVDNDNVKPAFERWISPDDGPVRFEGQHISVRVLDRDAVQIRKNGKRLSDDDADVTVE
ncbi:MAG: helix-turn-helix domain-containing protein [Verrucomicrobiota bacterium]|nr:helix-turn-helix domain-containing protein [Verrucomicrobiota bacterium]